jgi:hypothetical protein
MLAGRALTYGDERLCPALALMAKCRLAAPSRNPMRRVPGIRRRIVEIPGAGFASPAISTASTSQATASAPSSATTRPAGRPKDSDQPRRRARTAALPLCLRRQGAARRRRLDQRLPALPARACSIFSSTIPRRCLDEITGYLRAARTNLAAGNALIGPDTGGAYDDLAFALPANASATYCKRKLPPRRKLFGDAAQVWEAL